MAVRRPDGRVEQVRVGTAFKSGEGFTLTLGEMSIGGTPDAAAPVRRSAPASSGGGGGGGDGIVFPNYGRSKGGPIAGASMGDLEFYANGARRTLNDASKSRWHDKERQLLAAIEAEIARQRGGDAGGSDGGYGGGGGGGYGGGGYGGGGGRGGGGYGGDDIPPPTDDDNIPF
ncbi:RNA-binding region RNP-1 [Myxococcus hansupus]|uniref:RNA-binding region RNP-1 n=1 Tax=Pseudomyxococcus hansupus TaxID=1297742 RepID=A0A0H4X3L7_9BACT|nr:RNA-binding region RNP-1 [Myxococcus hansupus]